MQSLSDLPTAPGLGTTAFIALALFALGAALAELLGKSIDRVWATVVLSHFLIWAVSLTIAFRTLSSGGRGGALAILLAAPTGSFLIQCFVFRRNPITKDAIYTLIGALLIFTNLMLIEWLVALSRPTRTEVTEAMLAADATLAVFAWIVVQERFERLMVYERSKSRVGLRPNSRQELSTYAREIWRSLILLIVAFCLVVGVLIKVAAPTLGLDQGARGGPERTLAVSSIVAIAIIFVFIARATLPNFPQTERRHLRGRRRWPVVHVPIPTWVLLLFAAILFGSLPVWAGSSTFHFRLIPAILAMVSGWLAADSIMANPARLQLVRLSIGARALASTFGVAVASAAFWLLTSGLWSSTAPATIGRSGISVLLFALGYTVLAISCGNIFWKCAGSKAEPPLRALTAEQPIINLTQDQVLYSGLFFFAAVLPVFVVARLEATGKYGMGIFAISYYTLAIAAPIFLRWLARNNQTHLASESEIDIGDSRAGNERTGDLISALLQRERAGQGDVGSLNRSRIDRLRVRVRFQNGIAWTCLATGFVWAVLKLFMPGLPWWL